MNIDERDEVYSLMVKYPEKVVIEYECSHEAEKLRHHYDYKKPFNVHLICAFCHSKIHFPLKYNNKSKLRTYREALGITKSILAAQAKVSHNSITQWEKGKRIPYASRIRLSHALGINQEDLLEKAKDLLF